MPAHATMIPEEQRGQLRQCLPQCSHSLETVYETVKHSPRSWNTTLSETLQQSRDM
jgi:hypothetical protein